MMSGFEGMDWSMGWSWVIGLILLVGIIGIIVRKSKNNSQREPSAMEILKKRYAKGEISRDEFKEKRSYM